MANDDLMDAVLKHADIVSVVSSYLPVTKKGRSHVCLCPFHDDKNPSLQISQEKQIFKCFVCGEGGNAISFVSKFEKIPFRQAMKKVAEISGYDDPRLNEFSVVTPKDESKNRLYKAMGDLQSYYRYSLSIPEGEAARKYLEARNLGPEIQERFGIGYAPKDGAKTIAYLQAKKHSLKVAEEAGVALNNGKDRFAGRISFALFNPQGQINGFSARRFEEGQEGGKYVNSPETPIFHKGENLYNYHNAVSASRIEGCCYLTEGFMDVIALYKAGIKAAVASMGTALTKEQVGLLKRLKCEIRLCLDGDGPGQEATLKTGSLLAKQGVPYRIVDYQGDLRDPDEILNQEGPEALVKRLNQLIQPFDFALNFYSKKSGEMDVGERKRLAERFLPYLRQTPAGIEYEDLLNRIADATSFHKEAIREMARSTVKQETPEDISFVQGRVNRLNPAGDPALSKLIRAERALLHYMVNDPVALEFYESQAIHFKGKPAHEEIAQYLAEYASSHPGTVDISLLEGYIEEQSDGEAKDTISELASIGLDESYPPLKDSTLEELRAAIEEETRNLTAIAAVKSTLNTGSAQDAAKANKAFLEQKRRLMEEKKKKGA